MILNYSLVVSPVPSDIDDKLLDGIALIKVPTLRLAVGSVGSLEKNYDVKSWLVMYFLSFGSEWRGGSKQTSRKLVCASAHSKCLLLLQFKCIIR